MNFSSQCDWTGSEQTFAFLLLFSILGLQLFSPKVGGKKPHHRLRAPSNVFCFFNSLYTDSRYRWFLAHWVATRCFLWMVYGSGEASYGAVCWGECNTCVHALCTKYRSACVCAACWESNHRTTEHLTCFYFTFGNCDFGAAIKIPSASNLRFLGLLVGNTSY